MSQFLFQTPAGYLYDYTQSKVLWLSIAAVLTTGLTIFTAVFAEPEGGNLTLMILVKFVQGAVTSFIPPGLNSITQGIVGAAGMTAQVAINEMMNHLGTGILVLTGSVVGVILYPDLGFLFIVSPIACAAFLFFLNKINPADIDHAEARGLVKDTTTTAPQTTADYVPPPESGEGPSPKKVVKTQPSFNFGWNSVGGSTFASSSGELKADSPLHVLRDPILLTFIGICFLFHTSNVSRFRLCLLCCASIVWTPLTFVVLHFFLCVCQGTVLPLVMQTLALDSGRSGILMSGLCIIVAQVFMVASAKICGEYSSVYGRKPLFLIGLFIVPVRCAILGLLLILRGDDGGSGFMQFLILSTQVMDGVGAGVFGTMYILVTSDISGGTGRFSMTLGLTTAAMSIGGTVSGYLGEALAQDIGYKEAFFILCIMSCVPALLYLFFMPETLPSLMKQGGEPHELGSIKSIKEEAHSQEEGDVAAKYAEMT